MGIIRSKSDELYTIKQNKTSFDDDKRYLLVTYFQHGHYKNN